jgi:hypothetical protein
MATVSDSAIMMSSLRDLMASPIRTALQRGARLTKEDQEFLFEKTLNEEIDRRRTAQATMSIGTWTPQQVEDIVRSELARDRQEQLRNLGSLTAMTQEMQRRGRDWPTMEGEQRVDKLNELFNELTVTQRLWRKQNLYLTPRMLRETFASDRYRPRFRRDAAALVALVAFTGADAKARAEAAAAAWQKEELTPMQLSARFPGSASAGEVPAASMMQELGDIATFALAGPRGAVSAPVLMNGKYYVGRVVDHVAARDAKFEDPAVQNELREICFDQVKAEFRRQALERARDRTEVWAPQRPGQ